EEPAAPPTVSLELLRTATYDEVCASLATALSLPDPTKLRLTRHNYFSCQPQRTAVKWRAAPSLDSLLTHGSHTVDTLYYEVLDLPLEEMEQLKTVKVSFHNERGEFVGEQHSLRLRRETTVADLLTELGTRLQQAAAAAAANRAAAAAAAATGGSQPAEASVGAVSGGNGDAAADQQQRLSQGGTGNGGAAVAAAAGPQPLSQAQQAQQQADEAALAAAAELVAAGRPMRLMELIQNKLYKVADPSETLDALNEAYWQLRAEFIPADQLADGLSGSDYLVHAAHMLLPPLPPKAAAYLAAQQQQQAAAAAAGTAGVSTEEAVATAVRGAGKAETSPQGRGTSGGAVPMEAEGGGGGSVKEDMEEDEAEGGERQGGDEAGQE
ncbi:hypothetical protein Agub_g12576, partial [Astrephomene gubernaculifera]